MPDDPSQPEVDPAIEKIMQEAAEAHERFVREDKEMNQAWTSGTLQDWVSRQLDQAKGEFNGEQDTGA